MATLIIENDYGRDIQRVWLTFFFTQTGTVYMDLGPLREGGATERPVEVPPSMPIGPLQTHAKVSFELADGKVMSLYSHDTVLGVNEQGENKIVIHDVDQYVELHTSGRPVQTRAIERIA